MTIAIAFWVFLLSASLIILASGQRHERYFLAAVVVATALTFVAQSIWGGREAYRIVFAIDIALWLLALIYVAKSARYWPIWFAGFHSITVATELGSMIFPGAMPGLYIDAAGFWALPALGFMAIAVTLDRRSSKLGDFG